MIDLHSHILFGLDDGPATLEGSLEIARAAVTAGTTTIVATPHADALHGVMPPARDAALAELRGALEDERIPLEVLPGAEVAIDVLLDLDDTTRDGLRLGAGPYLLLECPLSPTTGPFDAYLSDLLRSGERLVLAHPERCPAFQNDVGRLSRLVELGAVTSVTATAFAGDFGGRVERFARQLVMLGLAHSVASDCHDAVRRPPQIRPALEQAGLGQPLIELLTQRAPAAILEGRVVPAAPANARTSPRRRRRLFKRRAVG